MKLACLTFTSSGEELAEKIKNTLCHDVDIFFRSDDKCPGKSLRDRFKSIFSLYEGIIFISSTGIAVRYIAPFIKDKTTDPAVVVVDDLGRYSISLLSGHIGGANSLADEIAKVIGATSVITTASDGRGIEAVDMFAKRQGLYLEDMNCAKVITALMLEGKIVKTIQIDLGDENTLKAEADNVDGIIAITPYVINNMLVDDMLVDDRGVDNYTKQNNSLPMCILRPRVFNIGIGCRKGKSAAQIKSSIIDVFSKNGLSINSIKAIATIDVKGQEAGIIETAKEFGCELKIFGSDEVKKVQDNFAKSNFVHTSIGVTSVCEPCAYLAGGRIIVNKTAIDGITVAVSLDEGNTADIRG